MFITVLIKRYYKSRDLISKSNEVRKCIMHMDVRSLVQRHIKYKSRKNRD